MSSNIKDVLKYFEEISKIPRCSYDEKKISDYLVKFGQDNNLETIQDEYNNVIIIKPASEGLEDKEGIILQGHMDMVCEKGNNSNHNFSCEPIELIYEDGYLRANNTTLGADNGIALAMAMALITDKDIKTPRIEFVATVSEETGMEGANGISDKILKGKYFINLDSEEEGYLIAGCAGGVNVDIKLKLEKTTTSGYFNRIHINNLKGGHSGMNIADNLLNAIICSGKVLEITELNYKTNLISINGGTKHNAIPRDAYIQFVTDRKLDMSIYDDLINEFKEVEHDIQITNEDEFVEKISCFSPESSINVTRLIKDLPNGAIGYMDGKYSDIVETSSNMAIVKTVGDEVSFKLSIRSSKNIKKEEVVSNIKNIIEKYSGSMTINDGYNSWEFKDNCSFRNIATKSYKDFTGKDMIVTVIHAGLECAVFQEKYPNLNIISIGPDMQYIHTPEERLDINSTERVYEYLKYLINNLSVK
ncbi:beta-Ala-His dipeptidase [Peptostreptococcaceae bacterium OttesenSCG-928-C18]|nr:beta-Ala-His dipeptidase [Peptostreptococcaceae bacterium OttesenSCG-928-C18]